MHWTLKARSQRGARVLIEAGIAGFVGLFAMCVCEWLELSQAFTVAAVSGCLRFDWIHRQTLELIQNVIVPKVGAGRRSSDDR
ncbi:phage holin family protein [Xylella fastidiosa subsp. multiplex]|nr:phage holin family protein [Xylella fastidiosa]MDG4873406.1 phage holin family protein [Xylella fastidiosa subsp. multiplex]